MKLEVTPGPKQIPFLARLKSVFRRRTTFRGTDRLASRGMWVRVNGKPGILTDLLADDIAVVMLTDSTGLNLLEVRIPAAELTQADFEDIPEKRRPPEELARAMGYWRRK